MDERKAFEELEKNLQSQSYRLNHLYKIKNKQGKIETLKLNWAQRTLLKSAWFFNVCLKSRQLGMTTVVMIYFLDYCLFNSNQAAGVIAHTKEDAQDLFDNKIKFAYDNLPDFIKKFRTAEVDTARKMVFNNGSSFTVGTSLRSGTYQKLLISEFGKLSAKYPEKAREIKTGALNTVEVGQQIFVESTAEGKSGEFYDLCEQAMNLQAQKKQLTRLEPRFHFFAWFDNPEYRLNDEEASLTIVSAELEKYLAQFPQLDANQRAWYAAKAAVMGDDMRREFCSTASEAFEGSLEGAFYAKEMQIVRESGGICRLPYDPAYPVSTYWDIGGSRDQFSIIFYQYIARQHRFINYHESNGQGWNFYAKLLNDLGYVYGKHYMPHDANTRRVGLNVYTSVELAEQVGIKPIEVIPVTKSVYEDIRNYCKPMLVQAMFDESHCALLIRRLDSYRRKWDDINGMWMNEAVHDESSHGCDAARTWAVATYKEPPGQLKTPDSFKFRPSFMSGNADSWMAG